MPHWPLETVVLEDKIHTYRVFKTKRKLIKVETNPRYRDPMAETTVEPIMGNVVLQTLARHREMVGHRFADEDVLMKDMILPLVSMAGRRLDPFDYNGMVKVVCDAEKRGEIARAVATELRVYLMERFF